MVVKLLENTSQFGQFGKCMFYFFEKGGLQPAGLWAVGLELTGGRVWWWECAYLLLVLELAGAPSWRKVLTALLNARKHFGKLWSNEKSKPSFWMLAALESMVVPFLSCVWSIVISLVHFGARIVVYGFAMFWYTWTFCIIYWCLCCIHLVVIVVVIVHWKKGTPNCTKTQPPHHAMAPLLAARSAHLCPVLKLSCPSFFWIKGSSY